MSKIRCDLCPIKDGAFKRSNGLRCGWAHVVCAIYIPEVSFTDLGTMELISVENISSERLGRSCVFCERNQRSSLANYGACIQCAWKNCRLYFHVSCAGLEGLLSELPATEANGSDMDQMSEQESHPYQLNGFCCLQHKKKFSEAPNSNSAPTILYSGSNNSKVCKSPTEETSNEVNSQSIKRRSSQLRLTQRSLDSDLNRMDDETFQDVVTKDYEKLTECTNGEPTGQNSSISQKSQFPDALCSPKSTSDCSDPKRSKTDVNWGENENLEIATSEQVPFKEVQSIESVDPKRHELPVLDQVDCLSSHPLDQEKTVKDQLSPYVSFSGESASVQGNESCDKNNASFNTSGPQNSSSFMSLESSSKSPCLVTVTPSVSISSLDIPQSVQSTEKHSPRGHQQNLVRKRRTKSSKCSASQSSSSSSTKMTTNQLAVTCSSSCVTITSQNSTTNSTTSIVAQDNLPLILPRRPLSLRGLGISCNSKNSSILNNIAGTYVDLPSMTPPNEISISGKGDSLLPPTLATMHDLLEWQWDQAGTLLMQQAKKTDVVTLLDCLHQLKCENDILEAKLVRLTTRHEHLRSVNARLSDSLATMEATMVMNSPKHETSEQNPVDVSVLTKKSNQQSHYHSSHLSDNNTTIQDSHISAVLHAVGRESQQNHLSDGMAKSYSRHSVTVFNKYTDPPNPKYSSTLNKKAPILPKDSDGCINPSLKRDPTNLTDSIRSLDKIQATTVCLTQNQLPIFCVSSNFSKSSNESQSTYSNLIKHQPYIFPSDASIQRTNQQKLNLSYSSNPCSTLPTTNSTYFTKSVDLNDLQELSARLSSAIAARQPQTSKSSSSTFPPCSTALRNTHSGQSKRNNKSLSNQPSTSSSKLPIQVLTSTCTSVNSISKLDALTNCQNYHLKDSINTQPLMFVDSNKIACHTDLSLIQLQKIPLENHSIISTNKTVSNEFSNMEVSVTLATNSNSVNLSSECKTDPAQ
ncbi:unnamed protein product [Heterobilharzia americana]|nr:unnamed protein product [Heterobilharzia americana]